MTKKEVVKKALREARKEEKSAVPTEDQIEGQDKDFMEQAKGLKKLLSRNLWFLKKK